MHYLYDKIYILGYGRTPLACAALIHGLGIACCFLEKPRMHQSFSEKRAHLLGIPYKSWNIEDIYAIFEQKGRILILSANNDFLFPKDLVSSTNVDIINYHNSLLPHHRGMNAEAWAIYDNNLRTGITWHFVNSGIDTGNIIFQESLPITDTTTSIQLLEKQSNLAVNVLRKNIYNILYGNIDIKSNTWEKEGSIHYKKDIPGNGILESKWSNSKIWNFLRAMDYGPLYNLGLPKILFNGKYYGWNKYFKIDNSKKYEKKFSKENNIIVNDIFMLTDIFEISER